MKQIKFFTGDRFSHGGGSVETYTSSEGDGYGDGECFGNGYGEGTGNGSGHGFNTGGSALYRVSKETYPFQLIQYLWKY